MTVSRRVLLKTIAGAGMAHLAVGALLSACAPTAPATATPAPKAEAKPADKPAAKPADKPVAAKAPAGAAKTTIIFSHYLDPAAAKAYDDIIANEWAKANPNTSVQVDISPEGEYTGKMLTQMGGGNFSDVLMVTDRYVPDFASRGVLLDMNDKIKTAEPDYDFKDLNEDLVQSGTWKGQTVAIFDYTGPIVIYYNKRLFKEAGVEPPKEKGLNWTFQEFGEIARKLTRGEGEKKVWACEGWGTSFCFQSYPVQSFGGKLVDHRGPAPADQVNFHWNTPEAKQAIQLQTDWITKDKIIPQPGAVQGDPFQAQRVAMKVVAGRWLGPLYTSFDWAKEDLGMLHQPLGGVTRQSRNGPRGLMIPKDAKNKDQAWEFVRFFTSKEGMQLLFRLKYGTPARKSLWEPFEKTLAPGEDVEVYRTSQKAMSELGALPTYPKFAAVNKVLTDNFNALWLGQQDIDATLKKIDTEANALMKQP